MNNPNYAISSHMVADIANSIDRDKSLMSKLAYVFDADNYLSDTVLSYGKANNQVSDVQIEEIRGIVADITSSSWEAKDYNIFEREDDLAYLDSVNRWHFRNSEGNMRCMYWLISLVTNVRPTYTMDTREELSTATDVSLDPNNVLRCFLKESPRYIAGVIRNALVPVPMQAKLPVQKASAIYGQLTEMSRPDKQLKSTAEEGKEIADLVMTTNMAQPIHVYLEGPKAYESAVRRLVQTVQSISSYRTSHSAGSLRTFLNSMASFIMFLDMRIPMDARLVVDAQMFLTNMEKQAHCHSYSAGQLILRAQANQVVYGEMLNVCTQWHSLINLEASLVFSSIVRLLKYMSTVMESRETDMDIGAEDRAAFEAKITALLTRCNVLQTYVVLKTTPQY